MQQLGFMGMLAQQQQVRPAAPVQPPAAAGVAAAAGILGHHPAQVAPVVSSVVNPSHSAAAVQHIPVNLPSHPIPHQQLPPQMPTAVSAAPVAPPPAAAPSQPSTGGWGATSVVVKQPPVSKPMPPAPTNVVITTSDKVPTTAPPMVSLPSITVPPQHRLGVKPQPPPVQPPPAPGTPNSSTHSYQMAMPKGASPVTSSPFAGQEGPAVPITTTSLLFNIPAPTYSAVGTLSNPNSPDKPGFQANSSANRQRQTSVSSQKSDAEVEEHDAMPDFKPIIPLPEEVEVTTGEEDEEVLIEDRCKLYRFIEGFSGKEWKERGLGQIKILKHKVSGKCRVLMRREQTLKICANHFLLPEMEVDKKGDKACSWTANDFADEEARVEQFSARFKTPEQTEAFIAKFREAVSGASIVSKTPEKAAEPSKASEPAAPPANLMALRPLMAQQPFL